MNEKNFIYNNYSNENNKKDNKYNSIIKNEKLKIYKIDNFQIISLHNQPNIKNYLEKKNNKISNNLSKIKLKDLYHNLKNNYNFNKKQNYFKNKILLLNQQINYEAYESDEINQLYTDIFKEKISFSKKKYYYHKFYKIKNKNKIKKRSNFPFRKKIFFKNRISTLVQGIFFIIDKIT
ncbi:MAG: hypothetical protein Q8888_02300 [Vigna little leaf phytoplasma]|nr:hypothetical protein [Vigna little leaf phytoplasma]